jgi:hypothetical protein
MLHRFKGRLVSAALVAALAFAGWSLLLSGKGSPSAQPHAGPLVLQQVQALGELRTTRFTYQHVFEHQTHLEPADWARPIPAMAGLVHAATRNKALVSVWGTIDAGVDLREARLMGDGVREWLELPQPVVYKPLVEARIHQNQPGAFWRDHNIGFDAQASAGRRFRQAALEHGILRSSREEAKRRVGELLAAAGANDMEIRFREGAQTSL